MKTLYGLISLVAIAVLLILSGLVGFLIVSDRLNAESAAVIAAALRGETPNVNEATTTAPAAAATSQPAAHQTAAASQPAMDAVSLGELRNALLARQIRIAKDRTARLNDAEMKLIHDRERFHREVDLFRKRTAAREKVEKDEGFAKALTMYSQMPPKQAKDHFMQLDMDIAVRYLMNMKDRTAAKILKEFKAPMEQQRCREILERISAQKIILAQNKPLQES